MSTRYSMMVTVAAAALLALGSPEAALSQMGYGQGHAHGQAMGMGMGPMDGMGDMMGTCLANAGKMGLSDDQLAKLKPLHNEMQKKQARFKADLKIAELELMEIMEVKDFDLEKAIAASKKIEEIKTAHHLEMLKHMKDVRASLTDEQFSKMKKMMPMKTGMKKPVKRAIKRR